MFINFANDGSRMQVSFKEMVATIDVGSKLHLLKMILGIFPALNATWIYIIGSDFVRPYLAIPIGK